MFKILTLNNISVKGLERLPRERYEAASFSKSPCREIVVIDSPWKTPTSPESGKRRATNLETEIELDAVL